MNGCGVRLRLVGPASRRSFNIYVSPEEDRRDAGPTGLLIVIFLDARLRGAHKISGTGVPPVPPEPLNYISQKRIYLKLALIPTQPGAFINAELACSPAVGDLPALDFIGCGTLP